MVCVPKFTLLIGGILVILIQNCSSTADSDKIPENALYFGWFFSDSIATSLQAITDGYLKQAFEDNEEVSDFLKHLSADNPLQFYKKPLDPLTGAYDPTYHVTAMYCGDKNCSAYYDKIKPTIDTKYQMDLIGVFFTDKTFGVRVLLTDEQLNMTDEVNQPVVPLPLNGIDDYPGIEFIPQPRNFTPSMSKAHVTLGTGPGIPAVQTGPDLLSIVSYENDQTEFGSTDFTLPNVGILRRYFPQESKNDTLAFVFYLNDKMVTSATFKTYINATITAGTVRRIPAPFNLMLGIIFILLVFFK